MQPSDVKLNLFKPAGPWLDAGEVRVRTTMSEPHPPIRYTRAYVIRGTDEPWREIYKPWPVVDLALLGISGENTYQRFGFTQRPPDDSGVEPGTDDSGTQG